MSVTLHTSLGDIKVRCVCDTGRGVLRGRTAGGGKLFGALCGWHLRRRALAPQHERCVRGLTQASWCRYVAR